MANNNLDTLTRHALSVAMTTPPARRQQLFSLLPSDTFKGPAIYCNLGRFFTTDTATESLSDIAKATALDPVALTNIMAEDESFRPLQEHLIPLLSARQAAAQAAGQDITQWAAAITRITEATYTKQPEWEQPLFFGEIETPALSVDLFPAWLREYCQAVIDSTQTPPGMTVILMLSVLAACLQKRFEVAPFGDDHREPLPFWGIVGLEPGNRKTAVIGALTFPLTSWENEQQNKYLPQIREVETKRATLDKRINDLITKAAKQDNRNERDAMLADVNRLKEEMPDELKPPLIWTDDTTPERLQGLLVENGERIALLSDEGGIFEVMAGLYSNGRANLNIFLKGHAGSECRAERQGRSARLESPCLTFGLAVQPDVISDLGHGDKKRFRGNGALARFWYCLPTSTIGNRDVTRRDSIPESLRARYQAGIDDLLNIAPITNEQGKEQPRILTLDPEARQSWVAFCQFIEANLGTRGELATIQDWASKLPGAAVRVAGLLHVAEHGTERQEIGNATMTAALDLAELMIKHTQAAFALMGDDEAVKDAKDVLRWIVEERRESFSQRDCQRAIRRLVLDRLERAAKILSERHIIGEPMKSGQGRGTAGGRPSISYIVNPGIFGNET